MSHSDAALLSSATVWQLAAARRRGIALHEVAEILAQDPDTPVPQRALLQRLATDWRGLPASGRGWTATLAQALPPSASATTAWLRAAEDAGSEVAALQAWSEDLRSREDTQRGRRVALTWPAAVAVCMLLIGLVAIEYVMPAFAEIWKDFGGDLPEPTRWAIALAGAIRRQWLSLLILLPLLALGLWLTRRRWGPWLQVIAEQLPFVRRMAVSRFVDRLLVLLLAHADAPALQAAALGHLEATAATRPWAACAARLRQALTEGRTLGAVLLSEPALPRRLGLHVQVGERAGNLADVLAHLRDLHAAEGQLWTARFERGALLLTYAVLGLLGLLLVSAIYLPIFKLGALF